MAAYTITAVCPIHNTGGDRGTRATGVGEFIVSSNILSICTVHRNSHRDLGTQEEIMVVQEGMPKLLLIVHSKIDHWNT